MDFILFFLQSLLQRQKDGNQRRSKDVLLALRTFIFGYVGIVIGLIDEYNPEALVSTAMTSLMNRLTNILKLYRFKFSV